MTLNVYPQTKSLYVHVRGLFADSTKKTLLVISDHPIAGKQSNQISGWSCASSKSWLNFRLEILSSQPALIKACSIPLMDSHTPCWAKLHESHLLLYQTILTWMDLQVGIAQNASLLSKAVEALPDHSHFDSYWLRNAEAMASHAPKTLATSVGSLSFRATLSAPGYSCDINSRQKNGALRFISWRDSNREVFLFVT